MRKLVSDVQAWDAVLMVTCPRKYPCTHFLRIEVVQCQPAHKSLERRNVYLVLVMFFGFGGHIRIFLYLVLALLSYCCVLPAYVFTLYLPFMLLS